MMKNIKLTLIPDGSSDTCLLEIIKWTLNDLYPRRVFEIDAADFTGLRNPPKTLEKKIKFANNFFPCDILVIHRDAEKTDKSIIEERRKEIIKAIQDNKKLIFVCIIPITMMETWLLIEVNALKKGAGNRNYTKQILLPPIGKLETLRNSKETLHKLLQDISGLKGRNLDKFNVHTAVHIVAENIKDFTPLRSLDAFKIFEAELKQKMENFLAN